MARKRRLTAEECEQDGRLAHALEIIFSVLNQRHPTSGEAQMGIRLSRDLATWLDDKAGALLREDPAPVTESKEA